ncbi:MAG: class I SAM-dependent methyltransferase [Methylococcales bacterium]|nr:class I SAM-dependent methyltransferase [Methylococcales bacterium]
MKKNNPARHWNKRFSAESHAWLKRPPRRLLRDFAHLLPTAGLALDAGAGVCTNALFLAARGLQVLALDISEIGLGLGLAAAKDQQLSLMAAAYDLRQLALPDATFDVIVNFRFLERATLPVYRRALKPGGVLFFETFVHRPYETEAPDFFLKPGELLRAFAGMEVLHHVLGEMNVGRRLGRGLESLIVRRPV